MLFGEVVFFAYFPSGSFDVFLRLQYLLLRRRDTNSMSYLTFYFKFDAQTLFLTWNIDICMFHTFCECVVCYACVSVCVHLCVWFLPLVLCLPYPVVRHGEHVYSRFF